MSSKKDRPVLLVYYGDFLFVRLRDNPYPTWMVKTEVGGRSLGIVSRPASRWHATGRVETFRTRAEAAQALQEQQP